MFWLGMMHLLLFVALAVYACFTDRLVLGINAMYKPMKFALSIWIYSWTMAILLQYFTNLRAVKIYTMVAVVAMCFEQWAITSQAFRGQLSHFNRSDLYGIVLFTLMGIFILALTLWTAYMTYMFYKQESYTLNPAMVIAIKYGLVMFVVFSLFGGYISSLSGHTVGAEDGSVGLPFLNWSRLFGDLRVAHFFGIHSLQIIPVFALGATKYLDISKAILAVKIFAGLLYVLVIGTLVQALLGRPFVL
jgi:hypothetical protein